MSKKGNTQRATGSRVMACAVPGIAAMMAMGASAYAKHAEKHQPDRGVTKLRAPFTYFGGKSRVADEIWRRFDASEVRLFIEPFFGSGATTLARPGGAHGTEIANDMDGYVLNFWRSVQQRPDVVARHLGGMVHELELEARHKWLIEHRRQQRLITKLRSDTEWCHPKLAAWWCWGHNAWLGSGFCSGVYYGPGDERNRGEGLGPTATKSGCKRPTAMPFGISRRMHHERVVWIKALAARLDRVRFLCGDWSRPITSAVKSKCMTAILFDPPYSAEAGRYQDVYRCEDLSVAHAVRKWCMQHDRLKHLRMALCGYDGEHNELEKRGWKVFAWKATGGFGLIAKGTGYTNREKERIWFSPYCKA